MDTENRMWGERGGYYHTIHIQATYGPMRKEGGLEHGKASETRHNRPKEGTPARFYPTGAPINAVLLGIDN